MAQWRQALILDLGADTDRGVRAVKASRRRLACPRPTHVQKHRRILRRTRSRLPLASACSVGIACREILVIAEIAMATMLFIGGGLVTHSVVNLSKVERYAERSGRGRLKGDRS